MVNINITKCQTQFFVPPDKSLTSPVEYCPSASGSNYCSLLAPALTKASLAKINDGRNPDDDCFWTCQ